MKTVTMSLPVSTLSKVLTVTLLIVNGLLILAVFRMTETKSETHSIDYRYYLEESIRQDAMINDTQIEQFLASVDVIDNLPESYNYFALVPQYPCDACIEKAVDQLLEKFDTCDNHCLFIVPKNRYKDIMVKLREDEHFSVMSYSLNEQTDFVLDAFDGVILFRMRNMMVIDSYVSNKWVPEGISQYLESVW